MLVVWMGQVEGSGISSAGDSVLRYFSPSVALLVNLTQVAVGVLCGQVGRSAGFYSTEVSKDKTDKRGHCRGGRGDERPMDPPQPVWREDIALLTAASPQLRCCSTALGKITKGNTPGRNKSEVTNGICWAGFFLSLLGERGDVHVWRPWEEAVPRSDEVGLWQDVCPREERKREGSWFLFVQVQSRAFQRNWSPCKEKECRNSTGISISFTPEPVPLELQEILQLLCCTHWLQ